MPFLSGPPKSVLAMGVRNVYNNNKAHKVLIKVQVGASGVKSS